MKTREELAANFDAKIAPAFRGFTAKQMEGIREGYIRCEMDDHATWYGFYVGMLGELMPEYGPEFLRSMYWKTIEDGETPKEAFIGTVCVALERDF